MDHFSSLDPQKPKRKASSESHRRTRFNPSVGESREGERKAPKDATGNIKRRRIEIEIKENKDIICSKFEDNIKGILEIIRTDFSAIPDDDLKKCNDLIKSFNRLLDRPEANVDQLANYERHSEQLCNSFRKLVDDARLNREIIRLTEDNARLTQEREASKRFDTERDEVFKQLTQLEETIKTASTDEIRLRLRSKDTMVRIADYEDRHQEAGLKERNILRKTEYCEYWIRYHEETRSNAITPVDEMNSSNDLKDIDQYKSELEMLINQYNELRECRDKVVEEKKKLMGLRTKLEDPHSSLNQAATSYQAQLGPDAVSPSIPAVLAYAKKRVDAVDAVNTLQERLDAQIAEIHEKLKGVSSDVPQSHGESPQGQLDLGSTMASMELLRDERNSYLIRSRKDGEIYCWPIGDGDSSLPYAFASTSGSAKLYFTDNEQDSRYQDEKHYWPIRRSDQIQSTDTDAFSLPLHENVPQIRQLFLAVINTEQEQIWIDGFFEHYRAVYSPQLQESDWRNFQDCRERFKTSHSRAQQELRSKQLNSEGLRDSCEQLTRNLKEMQEAFLPLRLRILIKSGEMLLDLNGRRKQFFTELVQSSTGVKVGASINESRERYRTRISEGKITLAGETREPAEALIKACEGLYESEVALREAMSPLVLKEKLEVAKEQHAVAVIIQKGSSDLIANPQFLDRCLQSLRQDIATAEWYFQDPIAAAEWYFRDSDIPPAGLLYTMLDRLSSGQEYVKEALPREIDPYIKAAIFRIEQGSSDQIQAHITSVQQMMKACSPVQEMLPILTTTTLESIQQGLPQQAKELAACLEDGDSVLYDANAFQSGKYIYSSAEECHSDGGKKVHTTLLAILSRLEERLGKFSSEDVLTLRRRLNRMLTEAETHLSSKLPEQTLRTNETFRNVYQYWQSHQGELAKQLPRDQYNHIKFTLYAIDNKYSEENAHPSILSQVAAGPDDSHTQITEGIGTSSQAEKRILSLITRFDEQESDYQSLLQIQQQFLEHRNEEHRNEERGKFLSRAEELSPNWRSCEIQIGRAFGVGVYEYGDRLLRDFENKKPDYRDKELNDNIRSIEVILEYAKCREAIGWLEQSDEPEYGHESQEETVTKRKARLLDEWVRRGKDSRVTPDVREKIGQILTRFARDGDTDANRRLVDLWDTYREDRAGKESRPPIYPEDLPPEQRRDEYLYLIDPSKIIVEESIHKILRNRKIIPGEKLEIEKDSKKKMIIQQEKMEKVLAPILRNDPPENYWRLCIDEKYQGENSISSLDIMHRVSPGQDEFSLMSGIMRGMILVFKTGRGRRVTPQYYQLLHHECIEGSTVIANGIVRRIEPGFRSLGLEDGPSGPQFSQFITFKVDRSPQGLEEACKNYKNRNGGDPRYPDGHPVGKALSFEDPHNSPGTYTTTPFTAEECETYAQRVLDKYYEESDQIHRKIANNHEQERWSHDLVKDLSEEENRELVRPIVHCCRDLEILHLFWDGTGRTTGFCLLTRLLWEVGLSPAIIRPDPWGLDHWGIEENVDAILEGQERFKSYKQGVRKT